MNNALIATGTAVCRLIGQFTTQNVVTNKSDYPHIRAMVRFAKMHHIETLLYASMKKSGFNDEELGDLPEIAERLSFCQIKSDRLAAKLSEKFSNLGIEHMILKGIEFSKYYPSGLLRTSSDIDVYMAKNNAEKIARSLEAQGFEQIENDENGISLIKKPYAHIEFHFSFSALTKQQTKFMENMVENAPHKSRFRKSFTDEENIIYALVHLYKHFSHNGAGVRMLLDINIMMKYGNYDRTALVNNIKLIGMERFFNSVCEISEYLFDGKELDERLVPALEFFLNSGSFGTNEAYLTVNAAKHSGKASKMKNYLKNEIGFSNENIKNKYPLAKKHPILVPYFHMHRVVSGLIHIKDVLSRVKSDSKVVTSSDGEEQMVKIMEVMGIKIKD